MRLRLVWAALAALVLAEIGYPLVAGPTRARLTVVTVLIGFVVSVTHAVVSRGRRAAITLVVVAAGGGLAVEALGVATGVPFGAYTYGDALGWKLLGVPLVIPLAWTWMAWPAWLAAGRLVSGAVGRPLRGRWRVPLAGLGLAAWDLFLDPQMVAERYWTWASPHPALPDVPEVPVANYAGWLVVAVVLMALLAAVPDTRRPGPADVGARDRADAPMYALYLWTYASGVLAHAVFLHLPASAAWGALGMGLVAVPLAVVLLRGFPKRAPLRTLRRAPLLRRIPVAGRPPQKQGKSPA